MISRNYNRAYNQLYKEEFNFPQKQRKCIQVQLSEFKSAGNLKPFVPR